MDARQESTASTFYKDVTLFMRQISRVFVASWPRSAVQLAELLVVHFPFYRLQPQKVRMNMSSNRHGRDAKSPSLIKQAVHRLQRIANIPLSDEVKQKTSLALLDYLGAIACGLEAPWASQICAYGRMRNSTPESHAWGINDNVSSNRAAFVNATLAHR